MFHNQKAKFAGSTNIKREKLTPEKKRFSDKTIM